MADNEYFDEITHLWDEEGFFARNMRGQLIRVVPATAKDYDEIVPSRLTARKFKFRVRFPQPMLRET